MINESRFVDYIILRKRIKSMRIRVTGASEVIVSAPLYIPEGRIVKFVEDNKLEISDRLKRINNKMYSSYPVNYSEGEAFLYLGEKIRLRIIDFGRSSYLYNSELFIHVPKNSDLSKRKAAFIRWIKRQAQEVFLERANNIIPLFHDIVKNELRITVKNMLTRWGSINTARQSISLSIHLIRCDTELIDYIITHELCHLIYKNHSKAFYRELEKFFPERKRLDRRLEEYGLVDFW
jgi:predicted metal-dependent hydrolase